MSVLPEGAGQDPGAAGKLVAAAVLYYDLARCLFT
jgi:hypothetical protein